MNETNDGKLSALDGISSPYVQGMFAAMHAIGMMLRATNQDGKVLLAAIEGQLAVVPDYFNTPELVKAYQFPLEMLRKGVSSVDDKLSERLQK